MLCAAGLAAAAALNDVEYVVSALVVFFLCCSYHSVVTGGGGGGWSVGVGYSLQEWRLILSSISAGTNVLRLLLLLWTAVGFSTFWRV